jgi:predicted transposase/invertase (TIGR01784 family)
MGRYLDPKYDLPFKRIFGEHKHLCISLINNMLPLEENRKVESIEYETGELFPETKDLKNTVVDVRCIDNFNRQFIVEMQMNWTENFKNRVQYNAAKTYSRQYERGKGYTLLHPVYSINFVNDIFEKSPEMQDEYYHHFKTVNVRHVEKCLNGMEYIFIELPKFKPGNRAMRKLHELWLRFLTEINESTDEAPPELLSDEYIREAVHYTEIGAYNKNQLLAYDKIRMAIMSEYTLISDSKEEGIAVGRVEGRAEGRAEGHAEGLAEGLEKGVEKGVEKVAINALKKGISPEDISDLTGLSLSEINKLTIGL